MNFDPRIQNALSTSVDQNARAVDYLREGRYAEGLAALSMAIVELNLAVSLIYANAATDSGRKGVTHEAR